MTVRWTLGNPMLIDRSWWGGALKRFWKDRGGNFAMMTAITFVPILLSVGAAVDMGLFYRGKSTVQAALDAAALAAAKQFPFEQDDKKLEQYANDFFLANTSSLLRMSATMSYEGTEWTSDKSRELKLAACFEYKPIFLAMLKVTFAGIEGSGCAEAESVIVVGNTTVEVALVLDTSGSMKDPPAKGGNAKIVTLRAQAAKSIETLFGSGVKTGDEDPVKIGIVPFSGGVNIGTDYLDKWWMDPDGRSPIHHENFDWTTYTGKVLGVETRLAAKSLVYPGAWILVAPPTTPTTFLTRQYIYKKLKAANSNWAYKGCVESRPGAKYALTDVPPTSSDPSSLFVPYFAPDESDQLTSDSNGLWSNNYLTDSSTGGAEDRMRNMNKYFSGGQGRAVGSNLARTPSWMCDSPPLTPLTTDKSTALKAVKDLVASGATNVPQGVEWGWKVLSKNEPFTDGRDAGDEKNVKAMIVMTDGENTYYNDTYNSTLKNPATSAFGAYGFTGYDTPETTTPRLFDYKSGVSTTTSTSNYTLAMDGRLAAICENAKNDGRIKLTTPRGVQLSDERGPVTRDGIIIYTIAFDIPASAKTRVDALLKGCSSYKLSDLKDTTKAYAKKEKYFYSADSDAQLQAAFSDIMASLSSLRIAR
ncbi:TadE/TadG family type IV pilus assembly protein [Aureimonas sp. ME7]|uniref:TadE/TadG family type IV pilus assembly protein n=1 Tax=Aureimonas sp. ME7 TaxID=2744252 RepID=UPI0015F68C20|nr:TadE/TadG family type IV pilus assembly protein [Aureimonas sp. ME7]